MAKKASTPAPVPQQPAIKVFIVDDHPIIRQGLAQLIRQEPDMVYCGDAEDASDALKAIEQCQPDIALVDISLKTSNGIELIKDLRIRQPNLAILVLSMHDESFYAERVLRAGARGYVMKEEATERVVQAIRQILAGKIYLSEKMSASMLSKLVEGRSAATSFPIDRLSDRELEVFELIGRGLGTRQIASKLHLSVKTIESHRANLKVKLQISSATELLRHAINWVQSEKPTQKA
ncbi:MAG: DNA-binding response regulator [Planctomycetaceae bacterium]|nr:MAG: DNA-binding response regulator [Planctomycetaceae bacterium]